MESKLKMVYWKGEKYWVGKLVDHPDVMSQGKTLEELEENIVDAYKLLVLDELDLALIESRKDELSRPLREYLRERRPQ